MNNRFLVSPVLVTNWTLYHLIEVVMARLIFSDTMGFSGSLIACFWAMGPNKETLFCEFYVFIFPIHKITLKLY